MRDGTLQELTQVELATIAGGLQPQVTVSTRVPRVRDDWTQSSYLRDLERWGRTHMH